MLIPNIGLVFDIHSLFNTFLVYKFYVKYLCTMYIHICFCFCVPIIIIFLDESGSDSEGAESTSSSYSSLSDFVSEMASSDMSPSKTFLNNAIITM